MEADEMQPFGRKLIMRALDFFFAVVGLFFPLSGQLAIAATRYVDASVSESGDGESWETAFKTIQEGIDAASDGDTVIVAEGIYYESIRFEGKNIVVCSTDPVDAGVVAGTVIDGNQSGAVVSFAGTEKETCTLSGFTIRNGRAAEGGGVCGGTWALRTRATIRDNAITGTQLQANGLAVAGLLIATGPSRTTGSSEIPRRALAAGFSAATA
jgi:hypothetical protein